MINVKRAYYYLFYKLYKWIGNDNWLVDWKAELSLDVLWIFLSISIIIYYTIFFDRFFQIGNGFYFLSGYLFLIALPNYFIFHHKNQWEEIVNEFDQLPKKKNILGGFIVLFFVLLIVSNMVFAFYQMSLIDWSKYR